MFLKESRVTLSFVVKSKLVTVLSLFLMQHWKIGNNITSKDVLVLALSRTSLSEHSQEEMSWILSPFIFNCALINCIGFCKSYAC